MEESSAVKTNEDHGLCITEIGLDLHGGALVMANTENFQEESFAQCVRFCMKTEPDLNHVLISYYNALIVGDKVERTTFFAIPRSLSLLSQARHIIIGDSH